MFGAAAVRLPTLRAGTHVALLHASIDTTASTAVLVTFYPAVDGSLLYVGIAVLAAMLVLVTRGRLGYGEEPEAAAPVRMATVGAQPRTE